MIIWGLLSVTCLALLSTGEEDPFPLWTETEASSPKTRMEKGSQEIGSGNNTETPGGATIPGVLTNWQLSLYYMCRIVFLQIHRLGCQHHKTQSTLKDLPRPKGNEPKPSE